MARATLSGAFGDPATSPTVRPGGVARDRLRRQGLRWEYLTLAWNVIGSGVVLTAAVITGSVALTGFGVDSLIEIGASVVVVRQLREVSASSEAVALRLIGAAFAALGLYLLVQAGYALASHAEPAPSPGGVAWLAATVGVMAVLALGKARTGRALGNAVLRAEARVTAVDGALAAAVLAGIVVDAAFGWWWADPVAGLVIVAYAVSEVRSLLTRPERS